MDFTTQCPPHYDTVWGFLATTEPHTLALMSDPINGLLADQDRARDLAQRYGAEIVNVTAPPALHRAGISDVLAFPLHVLHDVFP